MIQWLRHSPLFNPTLPRPMTMTNYTGTILRRATALAASLLLAACGGASESAPGATGENDPGEYVVERSESAGVETVRTVSGSRWGGSPRLIEELSIGEEMGEDAYLFGSISSAWATDDRIYVVDGQVPAVRAFDHEGNFLHQLGGVGQGPGEYLRPVALAVTDEGNVLVTDLQGARLNIFGADGQRIDDWPLGTPQAAIGLMLALDGKVYTQVFEIPTESTGGPIEIQGAMRQVGDDGHFGEPIRPPEVDWEPPTVEVDAGGNNFAMALLPFTPSFEWTLAPGGEVVAGVGNEYRFEVYDPNGNTKVVEKAWTPVPVVDDERDFRAEMAVTRVRQMAPDFSIPASDVPDHKGAFTALFPDRNGRVWVTREGPSEPDPDCRETMGGTGMMMMMSSGGRTDVRLDPGADSEYEDECWRNTYLFDVFDIATGEFLGTVPEPEPGFTRPHFIDDDTVLASVADEMGTVRLKKYRLVIE
jgi:hypothetical protein